MSREKLYKSIPVFWEDIGNVNLNESGKKGLKMKFMFRKVWGSLLIILVVLMAGFLFRYHYEVVEDVGLNTTLVNSVNLKNEVMRAIRFDRWTGAVEVYLDKGRWSDLADWNKDKVQTIQTSVRELTSAG